MLLMWFKSNCGLSCGNIRNMWCFLHDSIKKLRWTKVYNPTIIFLKLAYMQSKAPWTQDYCYDEAKGVTRGSGGATARATSQCGAKSLLGVPNGCGWGREKVPKMSQALCSIQCICFRKTWVSNMGRQTSFFLRAQSNLVTPLDEATGFGQIRLQMTFKAIRSKASKKCCGHLPVKQVNRLLKIHLKMR